MLSSSDDLQNELNRLQHLVDRRDAVLSAMAEVSRLLSLHLDPLEEAPRMLELIGRALEVSRAYIFVNGENEAGERTISQCAEWSAPGFPPQIDNPDLQDLPYETAGYSRWETLLSQNQLLYGIVADFPVDEHELLVNQDILSLIVAPIFVHDTWWGFMGFDDCTTSHIWEPVEAETLRSLAVMFGVALHNQQIQQQILNSQHEMLRELSTPLLPIADEIMVLPLIGTIDRQRAAQVMETLLEGVARYQATLVIVDITGVAMVDTQVAQTLIQAARAVKLLGARVMLTGIKPQIAQTLVHLDVDLSDINMQGSLKSGIAAALQTMQKG